MHRFGKNFVSRVREISLWVEADIGGRIQGTCLEAVSKIVPEQYADTSEVHEAQVVGYMIFPASQDPAEVLQPGKQTLDAPWVWIG